MLDGVFEGDLSSFVLRACLWCSHGGQASREDSQNKQTFIINIMLIIDS